MLASRGGIAGSDDGPAVAAHSLDLFVEVGYPFVDGLEGVVVELLGLFVGCASRGGGLLAGLIYRRGLGLITRYAGRSRGVLLVRGVGVGSIVVLSLEDTGWLQSAFKTLGRHFQ